MTGEAAVWVSFLRKSAPGLWTLRKAGCPQPPHLSAAPTDPTGPGKVLPMYPVRCVTYVYGRADATALTPTLSPRERE
jgi:hypothetical protein